MAISFTFATMIIIIKRINSKFVYYYWLNFVVIFATLVTAVTSVTIVILLLYVPWLQLLPCVTVVNLLR